MLKGKKIVLGITGSIAAYKSCLIIRGLIKRGAGTSRHHSGRQGVHYSHHSECLDA